MAVRPIDANSLLDELTQIAHGMGRISIHISDMVKVMTRVVERQTTLTPPNKWVSVEERLPEPTYCVLVYTTDYSIEVDALDSDGEWMSYEVTHWMPLPAPPDRRPPEGEA